MEVQQCRLTSWGKLLRSVAGRACRHLLPKALW
jgi:hypothetical protein